MFRFLRQHTVLSLAFAAALAVTLLFAVRFTVSAVLWSDPDRYEQPIAGWMTLRYVSRSWQVEPGVVADALGIEIDRTARRMTLEEIAAAQGRSTDDLILTLESVLADVRGDKDD